jgi:hypothetical protein
VKRQTEGGDIMKKIGLIALGVSALLAACATITQYPIQLRYTPPEGRARVQEKLKARVITVTAFHDKRDVADPHTIGTRVTYKGITIPFISQKEQPAVEIDHAVKTYLSHEGYTVREETPQWDLNPQTVQGEWGDWVIGGAIENLSVEARSSLFRTVYECRFKLKVVAVGVREKKDIVRETIELSSSYKTFAFRLQSAERMVNKLIAQAIEGALAEIEKK